MPTTEVKIVLDLATGTEEKSGSSIAVTSILDQCDLTDLATGLGVARKWATFEPDSWLLDGNYHIMPESAHVGVITGTITDSNGDFAVPVNIQITFDDAYDLSYGLTLKFSEATEDYLSDIHIYFYDSSYVGIDDSAYSPDDYEFFCELPASPLSGVKYIEIVLNSTNNPFRHGRLTDITFDTIEFKNSQIKEAQIVEELSPIAIEIPANSLEFTIHSDDGDFSIIDPQGIYAQLERHQKIDVYEYIDGVEEYMGRFYLEKWNSENDKLATFEAIDALQILGTIPYVNSGNYLADGSFSFPQHDLEDFFDFYFNDDTGFTFDIDSSLLSEYVDGWVPLYQSCRDVLQNICFALGAYITCARSSSIRIIPMELAEDVTVFDYTLTNSDLANRNIRQIPLVTGVRMTAHYWQDTTEFANHQIYDDNIATGTYKFLVPEDAMLTGTVKSGTATVNLTLARLYCIVEVTGAGTLDLEIQDARKHVREEHEQAVTGLPSGTPDNFIEIEDAYFITPTNVDTVLQRLVDYYSQKFELKSRLFASDIAVADSIEADTQKSTKVFNGIIEKAEINLVGLRTDITSIGNIEAT